MATVMMPVLVDDINGTSDQVRSVMFAFDGAIYEIDLGPDALLGLEDALTPYIVAGRLIKSARSSQSAAKPSSKSRARTPKSPPLAQPVRNEVDNILIRQWALDAGLPVKYRGRIPAAIMQAFIDAHNPNVD